jgi:RND family efflux transporter MFP subunit
VTGPGIVAPAAAGDWTIHAPETARIVALAKAEGDAVETGDVLVRFEYATTTDQTSREIELVSANQRLTAAKADVAKIAPLFERGYASRAEFEAAQSQVASAELEVTRLKRMLDTAKADADRAVIRARFNGVVAKVFHKEGDMVTGSSLDPVLRVVDPKQVEVVMSVPVKDLPLIQVGQAGTILSASGPEPGTVSVRPLPTDPQAVTQEIRLAFVTPTALPIDSPVSAEILLSERPNVIALPTAAVIHDGPDKSYVMIVPADGRAQRRDVRVGLTAGDRIEIVTGVSPGDRVIVKDATNVAAGTAVVADR